MCSKLFGYIKKKFSTSIDSQIESARQKLISDFEQKGMANFILQMANRNLYSELLVERQKTSLSSEDTISMQAFRYSTKLRSEKDKNELLALLTNESYADHQRAIYGCLACICRNNNDKDLFKFLMDKLANEDDERTIITILSRLEDVKKDESFKIDIIKKFAIEGTSDISHAAIRALSNSTDPEVEDILLEEFKNASKHMKGIICRPLSTVGTAKSIPILESNYKKTRDSNLRMAIENAINRIREKSSH